MLKIDSLRTALTQAIPELARNPENLRIWIERGTGKCQSTETEAFALWFQANVLVIEMATDLAVLSLAVFRWLRVNQPELLAPGTDSFSFDADILENKCSDVLLQIQIRENVTVASDGAGGSTLAYLPEPDPLFLDDLGAGGTDPVPPLADLEFDEDVLPWNP